jgi:Zn-dependent peptidase ImmA (M78 family)
MTGEALAQWVIQKYNTTDVLTIAERAGVTLVYAKWHPTTYGEFNKKTQVITINENSPIPLSEVLAHELGHYFSYIVDNQLNIQDEEESAVAFAKLLVGIH